MPNIYKTTHNHFIQTHFETGRNKIVNHEKFTFALHANYYSVPIMISVKMLPNYSNNIYYVSVLREVPIDYDFIITTNNGKIEMISKGIFNKIFNSSSISLFNSIDYYINFICKEYFLGIGKIYDKNYKILDLTQQNLEKKIYKYTLLHFRSDTIIDNILREFKKNENNSNNAYLSPQQSIIDSPIMKILQFKEKIMQNFQKDSIKKYASIESFNIYLNEYLIMFKLFSNINSDGDVNLDEMKLIDQYIHKKEDDIQDPYQTVRLLYGRPEPNEEKKRNIDLNVYNIASINKIKANQLYSDNNLPLIHIDKKEKDNENNINANVNIKKIDKEQFKVYMSMKNRYKQKRENTEVNFIFLYNLGFLLIIIVLTTVNYIANEKKILEIFNCLNNEYFKITPMFDDFTIIHKNFYYLVNKDKYFSREQNDIQHMEYLYNNSLIAIEELNNIVHLLNVLTYDFSDTFLELFNQTLIYQTKDYLNLTMSLENYILSLSTMINSIDSIDRIDRGNENLENLLTNLNVDFYQKLGQGINYSLNSTLSNIENLQVNNIIYVSILMGLIVAFGVYIYSRILCFYCVQNNMIGLLLSIDYEECDNILRLIRELRSISQRRQNDDDTTNRKKNHVYGSNENEQLLNNKNEESDNNTSSHLTSRKYNEKEFEKKITKLVNEQANKKRKLYMKKNEKKVQYNKFVQSKKVNNIPPKVYLFFLFKILIIIFLNLSPFIFSLVNKFYEQKSSKIINLIKNLNINRQSFLFSYLSFQSILLEEQVSPINTYILSSVLNLMKQNQFNTTSFFFDALKGFNSLTDFEIFFVKNYCNKSNTPIRYCNSTSHYIEQSFLYITNINIELIEDFTVNTQLLNNLNKSQDEIDVYVHDERVFYADETFNLLSLYGFHQERVYLQELVSIFVKNFRKEQIIIFVFNIFLMIFNQIVSIYLMKHIIEAVDVELKNIFSLMPFPLALEDRNIKELLSK